MQHRADLFDCLRGRGPETDADFRIRILGTITDLGLVSSFPTTISEIQIAIGADLDRLAAHFDLERKLNV